MDDFGSPAGLLLCYLLPLYPTKINVWAAIGSQHRPTGRWPAYLYKSACEPMSHSIVRRMRLLDPQLLPNIYVIIPVASIGCGKTTIGKSLSRLFGWPIVQNDDIALDLMNRKAAFVDAIIMALVKQKEQNPGPKSLVVFAERNNHLDTERAQIMHDLNAVLLRYCSSITYICLAFDHSNISQLNGITSRRVVGRGDHHKTVQLSIMGEAAIRDLMQGFQARFQSCGLRLRFDHVIKLYVTHQDSSRSNLDIIIDQLREACPELIPYRPTTEEVDRAFKETILEFELGKSALVARNSPPLFI
jgi:tRNA ligase